MKFLHLIAGICFLHQICAQDLSGLNLSLACISTPQLLGSTAMACQQKNNTDLWKKIIECHRPMSDMFMRFSSEARCPKNAPVANPMDLRFSIEEVFFNVCAIVEVSPQNRLEGISCLVNGTKIPYRMSHDVEVSVVRLLFGEQVPCSIGQCVKKLFNFN